MIFAIQKDYSPVCGSDGQTYDNICSMKRSACQKEEDLQLSEPGRCSKI